MLHGQAPAHGSRPAKKGLAMIARIAAHYMFALS